MSAEAIHYFLPVLLSVLVTGCGRSELVALNELEQEAAGSLVLPLALYEAQFPDGRITNVAQVFGVLDLSRSHRSHPFVFQERFRRFDSQAGFTNSIFEKYVVIPAGITNEQTGGELVLMSATPFPDFEKVLTRMVIVRAGKQDYRASKIADSQVQEIFRRSGIAIPKPIRMSAAEAPLGYEKPNYRLATRFRMFFENVAYAYGPGRFFWLPTMLICIGVPILGATFFVIWFARRGR